MKIIAFLTEYAVADRIIDHLKLTFAAAKPPPSHVFEQVALTVVRFSRLVDIAAWLPIGFRHSQEGRFIAHGEFLAALI